MLHTWYAFYPHTNSKSLELLLCPFGRCQNSGLVKPKATWLVNSRVTAGTPGIWFWGWPPPVATLSCTWSSGVWYHLSPCSLWTSQNAPGRWAQDSHQSTQVRTAASHALQHLRGDQVTTLERSGQANGKYPSHTVYFHPPSLKGKADLSVANSASWVEQ